MLTHSIMMGECYYCGEKLSVIEDKGCQSQEFPKDAVNRFCTIADWVRTQKAEKEKRK